MSIASAEPALYEVDDEGVPTLYAMTDSTGYVTYPFQHLGSQKTGEFGDQVSRTKLRGTGTVTALATVNFHQNPEIEVPYVVASIVLDEGPMVRAVVAPGTEPSIGTRVRATTTRVARKETELAELRFAPVVEENP